MLFVNATVTFHFQNGSITTCPFWATVRNRALNCVTFIVSRAMTSWRSGRSNTSVESRGPYPFSGGTTRRRLSPTRIPLTPPLKGCGLRVGHVVLSDPHVCCVKHLARIRERPDVRHCDRVAGLNGLLRNEGGWALEKK